METVNPEVAGSSPVEPAIFSDRDRLSLTEDDLETFEGWLKFQSFFGPLSPDDRAELRRHFDRIQNEKALTTPIGSIRLPSLRPDEYRYGVAVQEGPKSWLWCGFVEIPRAIIYVMIPRADSEWAIHTSYHRDGRFHMKSHRSTTLPASHHTGCPCGWSGLRSFSLSGSFQCRSRWP
jgi:hypothetical protein